MTERKGRQVKEGNKRAASGGSSPSSAASLICHFTVGQEAQVLRCHQRLLWFAARTCDSSEAKPKGPLGIFSRGGGLH